MSRMPDLTAVAGPIAVVCHDAGATNLIVGWLDGCTADIRAHMGGPAAAIWAGRYPQWPSVSLDRALDGAALLISGTGWASQLEHDARVAAAAHGIPTVAAVDHWVNYRDRFVRNGIERLPDAVWVADDYAFARAQAAFPEIEVRQFDNAYLREQADSVRTAEARLPRGARPRVLYALEPMRMAWETRDERPGEFQALDYFISRLDALGLADAEIRLRSHPSDPAGKYDAWIAAQYSDDIRLVDDEPIAEAIAWSDVVAGCESFVLIIGVAAGRKVISTLPPHAHEIRLPHEGIVRLRDL